LTTRPPVHVSMELFYEDHKPSGMLWAACVCCLVAVLMASAVSLWAADGVGEIPSDAGQVWKTYDISPFVQQAGAGSQKHVVDWVLQETGYASWHGDTVTALSATQSVLRCFHTPAMQARVEEIVARFVEDADLPHRFSVRVFGVGSPSWRSDAHAILQPIPAATPGVQAWMMSREEAVILVATLVRRSDCQQLPTGPVQAANGLPAMLAGGRKKSYVQDVGLRPEMGPGWQMLGGSCDEGIALDVHPLMLRDEAGVEAVVRLRIDQVERMVPVVVGGPIQKNSRLQIEVPQMSAVRIGERFRWPATKALVIGMGLVPWPMPGQNAAAATLPSTPQRTDLVVVVEPRLRSAQ